MPKTKKDAPRIALALTSREALISTVNRLVAAQLDLAARRAAHEQKIAELNAAFESDPEIERLGADLAGLESSVQLYCINHRAELFPDGKRKSLHLANATIGFRDNPPAVGKLLKGDKEEAIAERMVEFEPLEPYVKLTLSIDKKGLLTHRAELEKDHPQALADAGLTFTQAETFFIEPKADSIDRTTLPAEAAVA